MAPPRIVPAARPDLSETLARGLVAAAQITEAVCVLGRRGYYRDSMGSVGKNERGIYDDALAIVTPEAVLPFNANTDPSVERSGIAMLKPGKWRYMPGMHHWQDKAKRYPAFVQAGVVTVVRDGTGDDTGWFGINIHRGSYLSTSSEGCQTIYPEQWDEFHSKLTEALRAHGLSQFWYVLTAREDT